MYKLYIKKSKNIHKKNHQILVIKTMIFLIKRVVIMQWSVLNIYGALSLPKHQRYQQKYHGLPAAGAEKISSFSPIVVFLTIPL